MAEFEHSVNDYLEVFKRRKMFVVGPFALVFFLALLLALLLPPVYRSTARILIEEQEIPSDLVRGSVSTFADQRIQSISQRVMTRANLAKVIEKFDIYKEERESQPIEMVVATMREAIKIETISADVIDPKSGRAGQVTIAYTVAFDYRDPQTAQQVTREISELFLNENAVSRTHAADEAASFLTGEANKLREEIRIDEEKISQFKKENVNHLPELNHYNFTQLEGVDRELINTNSQIATLQERKFMLEGEFSQLDPFGGVTTETGERVLSKSAKLNMLRSQYPTLLSRYSADHPNVTRMRREIQVLEAELGQGPSRSALNQQLHDAQARLASLKKRYSEGHPEIRKLKRQIKTLQQMPSSSGRSSSNVGMAPESPAYIAMRSRVAAVRSELNALFARKKEIEAKQRDIRSRLTQAPQVELEYQDLLRRYKSKTSRYEEIKSKEMEAKISQKLESERKGERFSLIEPAEYPLQPIKPNRKIILFLGLLLAMASGVGVALLLEMLDSSIHNEATVLSVVGVAPLVTIPYLEDANDAVARTSTTKIVSIAGTVFVLSLLVVIVVARSG